ncbi:FAD:protein FMN transferase [Flavobacterium cheniae]|uniref:FAD:protein FMN transferase n=1 Tax=Flavobacterium cheniae TaxID=295428 RepID=A0A562KLI5_9FLAO|nr:FAD:protein FMN transferase [Flavobacterium cheniae]TDR24107.1 thiamine biosynthesis lipoprotein [Flavobacterium cheniae]TWH96227.1 thiamine biosynthesis lipoprotein [Flavobacterium cheniae]
MKELKRFCSFLVVAVLLVSCDKATDFHIIQGEAQGSTYSIKYIASEEKVTKNQIDSLLTAFDLSLSTYRPDSKISKINSGDSTIVVDDFFTETFQLSNLIYKETNGLFDPTIGVLVNAYGFGPNKKQQNLSQKQIDSLLQFVGFDKIALNSNKTISKKHQETFIDFNAIAQGYSVDVVVNYLKSKGIENAIVEIGGELFALGKNTIENKNWVVGIDDPLQKPEERTLIAKVNLENLGMATSGNYRKVMIDEVTGNKFVHIINPKTGLAQKNNVLSATVLSKSSAISDGYATAFMLMSLEESKVFLQKHPELYVMLLYSDSDNKMQQFTTENFNSLIID